MPLPIAAISLMVLALGTELLAANKPPAIGEKAPDFKLQSLAEKEVRLSELVPSGPVVVVALRGYPGYQCPVCSKQFGSFLEKSDSFAESKAQVIFIYPGPAEKLTEHAKEFIKGSDFPKHFQLLLDPDYEFARAYGIRWDEPDETVYPSTFVIDGDHKVTFAKVSQTHGGRAKVDDVLKAIAK